MINVILPVQPQFTLYPFLILFRLLAHNPAHRRSLHSSDLRLRRGDRPCSCRGGSRCHSCGGSESGDCICSGECPVSFAPGLFTVLTLDCTAGTVFTVIASEVEVEVVVRVVVVSSVVKPPASLALPTARSLIPFTLSTRSCTLHSSPARCLCPLNHPNRGRLQRSMTNSCPPYLLRVSCGRSDPVQASSRDLARCHVGRWNGFSNRSGVERGYMVSSPPLSRLPLAPPALLFLLYRFLLLALLSLLRGIRRRHSLLDTYHPQSDSVIRNGLL
jgi:hypothetical protein